MRIWVDLENTPHVLILKPIIEELRQRQHEVLITARDCSQTLELADYFKLNAQRISHHHGRRTMNKILGHFSRILRLIKFSRHQNFAVALSHGSRSQIIAAGMMKIPTVVMWDYEYASLSLIHRFIDRLMIPEMLSPEAFQGRLMASKIINYPGIKEHLYVANLMNNGATLQELSLDPEKIIITIRPPASEAHYHHPGDGSRDLFFDTLKHIARVDNTTIIILARTRHQEREIQTFIQGNGTAGHIIFPKKAQNGIVLIWNSDLVIGGGGTMNREAAVLEVPAYSIFQGKLGAVDRYLSETGRLKLIRSSQDLKSIAIMKRQRPSQPRLPENQELINFVVTRIEETGMMGR